MAVRKCWFIEEIELEGGDIGHRQTVMEFESTTSEWIRPDNRLEDKNAIDLWAEITKQVGDVNGLDLTNCLNPVAIMDYCNDASLQRGKRKLGNDDREIYDVRKVLKPEIAEIAEK